MNQLSSAEGLSKGFSTETATQAAQARSRLGHERSMQAERMAFELIEAGRQFNARGWVPATGGNFSARLSSDAMLITASGTHKGELVREDLLVADFNGQALNSTRKTSYETGLHTQLYRMDPAIGAVLHVHSIANTVLSRRHSVIRLQGYELQKLLPGVIEPSICSEIPVFENNQNIAELAEVVDAHLRARPRLAAYLIAGHGLYAWGATVAQARHRVEALEFMLECELWSGGKG